MVGYYSTPWHEEETNVWHCLDWQFHECYAESNDLNKCCVEASELTGFDIYYEYYPPFLHYGVKGASIVSGLPTSFWLAMAGAIAVMTLALILLVRSGLVSFVIFFSLIPGGLYLFFDRMPFTWVDGVACGSFPFIIAMALFALLLFEWRNMRFGMLLGLFLLMAGVHNFGWILNCFLILSIAFAWFILRDSDLVHIVALILSFVWIMVFANSIYPNNSVRIVFIFFFLVSYQVGKYFEGVLELC